MRRWWNRLSVFVILAIAAGAIYAVWPDEPDRYLPDVLSLPSGRGLPGTILGIDLPCKSSDNPVLSATAVAIPVPGSAPLPPTSATNPSTNCQGMTLGLDLQGGSRIRLQADLSGLQVTDADLSDGLDAAKTIIENRVNPIGVSEAQVQRSGKDGLIIELPGVSAQEARDITRPAVLMFCEGLQPGGQAGGAGTPLGTVSDARAIIYKPGTCQPDIDAAGQVALRGAEGAVTRVTPSFTTTPSRDNVVWIPAKGDLNGAPTIMTGSFLKSNVSVQFGSLGEPLLVFNMNRDGEKVFGSLSQRLIGLPLATFLDGEPVRGKDGQIIAPTINGQITSTGQTTGLALNDAKKLKTFLNNGAFPIPLKVVQQQDVDATLGDKAVLHSVQAGLVAMLLIMAFMTLYYRLPGAIASLALVVYTAIVLAIFKIGIPGSGPVTLTLAGIAAFVLSVGIAVDANILIFERTKEELRNGRSLIPAVEAGFSRAWTSIRDSNISTLITCGILYWMGNAFASSLIKGFALTLAIGVLVSLFSAITVTRSFLRLAIATPLARPLWLWTDDVPDAETPMSTRGVAGMEAADA